MLRIIGGKWRSRKISFPEVNGLRPTGDRMRETLFNWLGSQLTGARCLDVFAGSGALGFEALSRGAKEVVMIEHDPAAFRQLSHNRDNLGAEAAVLLNADALHRLKQPFGKPFDVIFIDPPFDSDCLQEVIDSIEASGLADKPAWIYVERSPQASYSAPETWQLWREKRMGSVSCQLWRVN